MLAVVYKWSAEGRELDVFADASVFDEIRQKLEAFECVFAVTQGRLGGEPNLSASVSARAIKADRCEIEEFLDSYNAEDK